MEIETDLKFWSDLVSRHVHLPTFSVIDTQSSHGRYSKVPKQITVIDLIKFHGHGCDGLFRGAYALSVGLKALFHQGPVDRTDLRILSRNSPCLGDVGEYLTGGRIRFNTQDVRDRAGVWYIIQRISNKDAVEVVEEADFFDPEITKHESSLANLRDQELSQAISNLKKMQDSWIIDTLLPSIPEEHYYASRVDFEWKDVPYSHIGNRTDIIFKDVR